MLQEEIDREVREQLANPNRTNNQLDPNLLAANQ